MRVPRVIWRLQPFREAHSHCDIPCGIYDPISAKIAAQTVLKMVVRIQALDYPTGEDQEDHISYRNSLGRYIADILWHDYFKPEHLEKYADLHNTVWETTKLASANKQGVDLDSARSLVGSEDKIAEIFWATKGIDYKDANAEVRFGV